jgi:hypothetical protein
MTLSLHDITINVKFIYTLNSITLFESHIYGVQAEVKKLKVVEHAKIPFPNSWGIQVQTLIEVIFFTTNFSLYLKWEDFKDAS